MLLNAHSNPHFGVGAEPWQDLLEPIAVDLVRKPPGQWDTRRKEINQYSKYIKYLYINNYIYIHIYIYIITSFSHIGKCLLAN